MAEELNQLQIKLLLYFLEAEPKKRTVTDAAKYLGKTKVFVTRTLDKLEKMDIVQRVESRKTVLTSYGNQLGMAYQKKLKVAERYMQFQDLPPALARENAMAMLSAGFTDEFINRMEEQEERLRVKEIFAGRNSFSGEELCENLKDGSYMLPFVIYREHIKNGNNLSMANQGFEHPCELVVKDHIGVVYLQIKNVSAPSAQGGRMMEGKIEKLQYQQEEQFLNAGREGRYVYFPASALSFITMGNGREEVLHGSVCLNMQCSVGALHMPESKALFTMLIS